MKEQHGRSGNKSGSKENHMVNQVKAYQQKRHVILMIVFAVWILTVVWSSLTGIANVNLMRIIATFVSETIFDAAPLTQTELTVLRDLRLPRIAMGVLAGVGLSVSGLVMQAITGNKMASPFTTGISNAAALGAASVIVFGVVPFGFMQLATVVSAFVFALVCTAVVYGIAGVKGMGKATIILTGIALNYLFSAMNASLQYIANEQQLSSIVHWTFGSLSGVDWMEIFIVAIVICAALPYIQRKAWALNLLSTGDESTVALGVNVRRLRLTGGIIVTLMAASVVSFCGVIGFVGLVAPHIARLLVGGDYRALIPLSSLLGGILVVGADTIGRTIASPVVIPVGIVISFIGVPVFISLILREKRERLA